NAARANGGPAASGEPARITVAGSSAMMPLLAEAATRFMRARAEVTVQISAGGSRQGVAQVASGAVTIGASDFAVTREQTGGVALEEHRVAATGFAAMAHRGAYNAAVTSLTHAQMRAVFAGEVRNWTQLGGNDQVLSVVHRARGSG